MDPIQREDLLEVEPGQLEELLARVRPRLSQDEYRLIEGLVRTFLWIRQSWQKKTLSIGRLLRMVFGSRTESSKKLLPGAAAAAAGGAAAAGSDPPKAKAKGHGRNAAKDYPAAQRVAISHPQLQAGDLCPGCQEGKLYLVKEPAKSLHFSAQPPLSATLYQAEVLRCSLCGQTFTAPLPVQAAEGKYDSSVGIMLAVLRYGGGVPMYRIDQLQRDFGVPLPASTQWEQIESAARQYQLIYQTLLDEAAQAQILHNDDTTMRVQSLRKEIQQSGGDNKERTGIFTTSILAQTNGHKVALFFTGQKHAGENLTELLRRRASGAPVPIQMCDGLSRNLSQEFQTILANCSAHARRHFVEVIDSFPQECKTVLESFQKIYHHDAQAKERSLSDQERLLFHQEHSKPVMEELQRWMKEQLEEKKVEPNSGLGEAITYMLKRWEPLTRFLHVAGAPLDNNAAERSLKMAILHRRNSLSYKTLRGAEVGDLFMSLIQTCRLHQINAFDYLKVLQQHAGKARQNPRAWLPCTYRATLQNIDSG
jgi:hypothetical protein